MVYILTAAAAGAGAEAAAVSGFDFFTPQGLGSIIALVAAAVSVWVAVRKNKQETDAGTRTYQKDVQIQMAADIAKLRENSEKYLILRKIIIEEPGVDSVTLIAKMETQYALMNP